MHGAGIMPFMARAALVGGAKAIRANGEDIATICNAVDLPVIGINKRVLPGFDVFITPEFEDMEFVAGSGAHIAAFDATARARPGSVSLEELVHAARLKFPELLLMADISTLQEGMFAAALGVDIIATTLSGYTPYTMGAMLPNIALVGALRRETDVPIVAEGGIATPAQAAQCLRAGAWAVTVGGAITRPHEIAGRFVKIMREEG